MTLWSSLSGLLLLCCGGASLSQLGWPCSSQEEQVEGGSVPCGLSISALLITCWVCCAGGGG